MYDNNNDCVLVNELQGGTGWLNSSGCHAVAAIIDCIIVGINIVCHGISIVLAVFGVDGSQKTICQ